MPKKIKKVVRRSKLETRVLKSRKSADELLFTIESLTVSGGKWKAAQLVVSPDKPLKLALSAKELKLNSDGYLTLKGLKVFGAAALGAMQSDDEDEEELDLEEEDEDKEEEALKKGKKAKVIDEEEEEDEKSKSKSKKKSKRKVEEDEDDDFEDFDDLDDED